MALGIAPTSRCSRSWSVLIKPWPLTIDHLVMRYEAGLHEGRYKAGSNRRRGMYDDWKKEPELRGLALAKGSGSGFPVGGQM